MVTRILPHKFRAKARAEGPCGKRALQRRADPRRHCTGMGLFDLSPPPGPTVYHWAFLRKTKRSTNPYETTPGTKRAVTATNAAARARMLMTD